MNDTHWTDLLNAEERTRYQRQMLIKELGPQGQVKLKHAKVLIVGVGGLGSPVALYLAAAGVGTLGLVDHDHVHLSNLNRQLLHHSDRVGMKKLDSAYHSINSLNPFVTLALHPLFLNQDNIEDLIQAYDVIVDAVDTIETRLLISDACYLLKKPLVEGAVVGLSGTLTTLHPDHGPCFRCMYPQLQINDQFNSCAELGILGAIAGVIGSMQALEVIKLITGIGEPLFKKMLVFEGLECSFTPIDIVAHSHCRLCSDQADILNIRHCGHL